MNYVTIQYYINGTHVKSMLIKIDLECLCKQLDFCTSTRKLCLNIMLIRFESRMVGIGSIWTRIEPRDSTDNKFGVDIVEFGA